MHPYTNDEIGEDKNKDNDCTISKQARESTRKKIRNPLDADLVELFKSQQKNGRYKSNFFGMQRLRHIDT